MKRMGLVGTILLAALAQAGELPTPESLVALAPRLALSEPGVTNFTVRGTLDAGDFKIQFDITAARPDSVVLSVIDPRDGTPLLFGCGGRMMLYDPMAGEVLVASAWPGTKMELELPEPATTNAAKLGFWFGFQTVKSNAVTIVDLASMERYASTDRKVREESPGRYQLSGLTKDGGRLRATVQPGRAEGAYVRLEASAPESPDRPALVLDEIRINTAIPSGTFDFPDRAIRESGLPVRNLEAGSFLGSMLDLGRVMKALVVRMALVLPDEAREELSGKLRLGRVDWAAVRARDAEMSRALRKAVPAAPGCPLRP
jgi:hypothetical protein